MLLVVGTLMLAALCVAAVWVDVRERRIPNQVALGALLGGVAWRVPFGIEAVGAGLLAAGIAFAFAFFFFLLGGLGAGDVKFMAGVSAFVGMEGLLVGLLAMATTGAGMALFAAGRRGLLTRTFRNLALIVLTFGRQSFRGWKGEGPTPTLANPGPDAVRSPYGIAIAVGAMTGWLAPLIGWSL